MPRKALSAVGLTIAAIVVALWLPLTTAQASVQCGGSFVPTLACTISGFWNYVATDAVSGLPTPFQINGTTATGVTSITKDLNNAQILALGSTPVTIVPAPGVGRYIDVIGAQLSFKYTAAYTAGVNLRLFYGSRQTGSAASEAITVSGLLVSVTANHIFRVLGTSSNTDLPTTNVPVVLQGVSPGTAFATGDPANVLRVVVNYRIVTTGLVANVTP